MHTPSCLLDRSEVERPDPGTGARQRLAVPRSLAELLAAEWIPADRRGPNAATDAPDLTPAETLQGIRDELAREPGSTLDCIAMIAVTAATDADRAGDPLVQLAYDTGERISAWERKNITDPAGLGRILAPLGEALLPDGPAPHVCPMASDDFDEGDWLCERWVNPGDPAVATAAGPVHYACLVRHLRDARRHLDAVLKVFGGGGQPRPVAVAAEALAAVSAVLVEVGNLAARTDPADRQADRLDGPVHATKRAG